VDRRDFLRLGAVGAAAFAGRRSAAAADPAASAPATGRVPVLFDTDIGSDIDDSVALAYLLSQRRCELLGITTVSSHPQIRAQLCDAVCQAFGRQNVPVHSGTGPALLVARRQREVPQKSVLSNWPHREDFAPNTAVDFMRNTIRSRPGEITLLSVGPATNSALLFALDPEIPSLLRQHVMMNGVYRVFSDMQGMTEWNTICDPHATAIAMNADVPRTVCIGLDVTERCRMASQECRCRFSAGPLRIIGEMAEVWFTRRPEITFHDPLAAAVIFEPSLCKLETGTVRVELQSDQLLGATVFKANTGPKRHHVAVDVNAEAFLDHYYKTVRA
jgi:purine nucleosidase